LNFTGSSGVTVQEAHSLGQLNGVWIQGITATNQRGVLVSRNSLATIGPAVTIDGFGTGIVADLGSTVSADSITVQDCAGAGFTSMQGSLMTATGATSTGNAGNGFDVYSLGSMIADGSTASGNQGCGFVVRRGTLNALNAVADNNTKHGFWARTASTLMIGGSTATGNTMSGFAVESGALMISSDAGVTSSGNSDYGVSVTDGGQFILATLTGTSTITNNSDAGIFLERNAFAKLGNLKICGNATHYNGITPGVVGADGSYLFRVVSCEQATCATGSCP
jgi:hypothetical protein